MSKTTKSPWLVEKEVEMIINGEKPFYDPHGDYTEERKWIIEHKEEIEKEFNQIIEIKNLFLFCCYDTLEDMKKDFYDLVDETKPYIKKVLDKWVIQIA